MLPGFWGVEVLSSGWERFIWGLRVRAALGFFGFGAEVVGGCEYTSRIRNFGFAGDEIAREVNLVVNVWKLHALGNAGQVSHPFYCAYTTPVPSDTLQEDIFVNKEWKTCISCAVWRSLCLNPKP